MKPALTVNEIPFYETPSEIEGAPYWVDLWTDVNGYKIGLQIKPKTYRSANLSVYAGKAKSSEEKGHKLFAKEFGGGVFIVSPENGTLSRKETGLIQAEYDFLKQRKPRK